MLRNLVKNCLTPSSADPVYPCRSSVRSLSQICSAGFVSTKPKDVSKYVVEDQHGTYIQPKPLCAFSVFTFYCTSQAGTSSTTSTNHEGKRMSNGGNRLPKFMPILFFGRVSLF